MLTSTLVASELLQYFTKADFDNTLLTSDKKLLACEDLNLGSFMTVFFVYSLKVSSRCGGRGT